MRLRRASFATVDFPPIYVRPVGEYFCAALIKMAGNGEPTLAKVQAMEHAELVKHAYARLIMLHKRHSYNKTYHGSEKGSLKQKEANERYQFKKKNAPDSIIRRQQQPVLPQ